MSKPTILTVDDDLQVSAAITRDVAIRAINDIGLDYYLLKPWDPPQERLYPVVDDLLGDWMRSRRWTAAPFSGSTSPTASRARW